MGDHAKQIEVLEAENRKLKKELNFWKREALKWCAKLGESRMKIRIILNQFGIKESDFPDEELVKFLEPKGEYINEKAAL